MRTSIFRGNQRGIALATSPFELEKELFTMRRYLALVVSSLLVACSGGGGSDPDGGPTSDSSSGDAGACTSSVTSTILVADFTFDFSLSVAGSDAYWIDSTQGSGSILKTGLIRHVALDGTGTVSTLVTPTAVLYGATAVGTDMFYFQEDDPQNSAIHLYRTPLATGGVGTQLGADTYNGLGGNLINACQGCGVFASRGTDIFVSDGDAVSRVSTTSGVKTIISAPSSFGQVSWPALVGNTVYYKSLTGEMYSAPADATTPSATRVGTATCGMGRYQWMGSSATEFLCGEPFGIDAIDITGTTQTHVIYTLMDNDPMAFNPSSVDGTTYYALPRDGVKSHPIYKLDTSSTAKTPVVCDVRAVTNYAVGASDLVWVEERQDSDASDATTSLRRIAR